MTNSYTVVSDAFFSGSMDFERDRAAARDISFLVDEGYLTLRVFPIAPYEKYISILEGLDHDVRADNAQGGSKEHVALKILSATYLQQSCGLKTRHEFPFCGYYPDTIDTSERIVVECGHTHNPDKMVAYFRLSNLQECICIPYPDPEAPHVLAYSFTPSVGLKDFLQFCEQEKYAELRKKLNS